MSLDDFSWSIELTIVSRLFAGTRMPTIPNSLVWDSLLGSGVARSASPFSQSDTSVIVRLRSRALIASSGLRLESGGQEDAVLLVLLSLGVVGDLCTQYLSRQ